MFFHMYTFEALNLKTGSNWLEKRYLLYDVIFKSEFSL